MTAPTRRRRPVAGSVGPAAGRSAAPPVGRRQARRRRQVRRAGTAALVLLAIVAALAGLVSSPLLAVRHVQVMGTSRATPEQVLAAADVRPGMPLARLPVAAVRRRVGALPAVDGPGGVAVTRRWPHTVVLAVRERVPVAAAPRPDGSVSLVDATGRAFATEPAAPAGVPVLQVDEGQGATVHAAVAVLGELPDWLRPQVLQVSAGTPESVVLHLASRTVVWGAPGGRRSAVAAKSAAVQALLPRPQRTIDVSAPSVVVTR